MSPCFSLVMVFVLQDQGCRIYHVYIDIIACTELYFALIPTVN